MVDTPHPDGRAVAPVANGRMTNPEVRHERTDVSFPWLLGIGVGSVVLAFIIHSAVWWFFLDYGGYQDEIKKPTFPLATGPASPLPEGPRLEPIDRLAGSESSDVYARHVAKEAVLNSYGPGQEKGFYRIPIEQAMAQMVKEQAFKTRPQPKGDRKREAGLLDAGGPNSGRVYRGGGS